MKALRFPLLSVLLAFAFVQAPLIVSAQDVGADTPLNLPTPKGVRIFADLAYVDSGNPRQKLDLYLPVPVPKTPMPVIVYLHGGGWQKGSKADGRAFAFRMVPQGYAVACVGYRLTDEAQFPAQLEDGKVAIRWLRDYAERYRLDPTRFGACGVSAGGWLAAMLGTTANFHLLDSGEHLNQSSGVQAACIFFAPIDLLRLYDYADEHGMPQAQEVTKLLGGNPHIMRAQVKTANPLTYAGAGMPPFLLVHGVEDTVVPPEQSRLCYDALAKLQLPVHLHLIHGAGHTGPAFVVPEINAMVDAFFAQNLKPGASLAVGSITTITESTARKN